MGLGPYVLVIYGLAFAFLAIAILWCVPGLRVTFVNVLFLYLEAQSRDSCLPSMIGRMPRNRY